jgi:hypothetical protein
MKIEVIDVEGKYFVLVEGEAYSQYSFQGIGRKRYDDRSFLAFRIWCDRMKNNYNIVLDPFKLSLSVDALFEDLLDVRDAQERFDEILIDFLEFRTVFEHTTCYQENNTLGKSEWCVYHSIENPNFYGNAASEDEAKALVLKMWGVESE